MLQKFKVALYVIMVSVCTLFVSTSSASHLGSSYDVIITHTPGVTVGPSARPPIKYEWFANPDKVHAATDEPHRTRCEMLLAGYTLEYKDGGMCQKADENYIVDVWGWRFSACVRSGLIQLGIGKNHYRLRGELYDTRLFSEWGTGLGLGTSIRYIQYTGDYCHYYKGGTSSERSGPETWRYDPE